MKNQWGQWSAGKDWDGAREQYFSEGTLHIVSTLKITFYVSKTKKTKDTGKTKVANKQKQKSLSFKRIT